jgi:hypothetical protein
MPFEFRLSFAAQFIDYDKYVSELQRGLRRLMREAAAVYYNNLIARIPVDTGFLAGSFDAIKKASGASGSPAPALRQIKGQFYTHFGGHKVAKNTTSGIPFATSPENVLTEITDGKFKYKLVFYFKNDIRYYPINDLYGANGRTPWRFTEKAVRATLAYIGANLPKLIPTATSRSIKQQLISYRPGVAPQKIKV